MSKEFGERARGIFNEIVWPVYGLVFYGRKQHYMVSRGVLAIQKGEGVLEAGAGYPLWRIYSGDVGEKGLFVSVDINRNIQRRSARLCRWLNKKNPQRISQEVLVVADVRRLPFRRESFDLATNSNLPANGLSEEYRVLKTGGRLVTAYLESAVLSASAKEKKRRKFEALGFQNIEVLGGAFIGLPFPIRNWYVRGEKAPAENL